MRHTIIVASISVVAASIVTTAVISGSLFGADTASSANTPVEAKGAVSPDAAGDILQGDVDCGGNVTPIDSLKTLRHDAGLSVQQDEPCPDIATVIPSGDGPVGPQGPQGPQGATGPAGPQGAQGLPGVNLFAHVDQHGVLEVGTAVSASKVSKGRYVVTFGQNVVDCAAVVSQGARDSGVTDLDATGNTYVSGLTPQDVEVDFNDPSWNPDDTDFNLIVVC